MSDWWLIPILAAMAGALAWLALNSIPGLIIALIGLALLFNVGRSAGR